jgi:hypothetical protein
VPFHLFLSLTLDELFNNDSALVHVSLASLACFLETAARTLTAQVCCGYVPTTNICSYTASTGVQLQRLARQRRLDLMPAGKAALAKVLAIDDTLMHWAAKVDGYRRLAQSERDLRECHRNAAAVASGEETVWKKWNVDDEQGGRSTSGSGSGGGGGGSDASATAAACSITTTADGSECGVEGVPAGVLPQLGL